jgi:hypothetical protein
MSALVPDERNGSGNGEESIKTDMGLYTVPEDQTLVFTQCPLTR